MDSRTGQVREHAYEERLHEGEREVQARLGVLEAQKPMSRILRPFMPPQHRAFFEDCLACLYVGSVDSRGRVWASVLPGLPGFIQSPTDTTLHVRTPIPPHDPLLDGLKPGAPVGLIGVQLHTRRRNRANGKVARVHDDGRGGFDFDLDLSFGNCPKYIQAREVDYAPDAEERLGRRCDVAESTGVLTPEMRAYVDRSDTFFVASCFLPDHNNPAHGVDMSHRGVEPGAIHFRDDATLVWPEYVGNFLFNTLGNLIKDPRCGLLFLDFGSEGDILQLTGRAHVEWDLREVPGAHRSVVFAVERALLVRGALSMLRSTFIERSAFLPAAQLREGIDFSTGLAGYPVTIVDKKMETHDTATLTLTSNVPLTSVQRPGQYGTFAIELDGGDGKGGETVTRSWTISSAPRSPAEYNIAITVKRLPGGKASAWLHDASVGDSFKLVHVAGTFHLPDLDKPGPLLFVAGGVGVTPLMSMLRGLVFRQLLKSDTPQAVDVAFLYSVKTPDDIIFAEELQKIRAILPGFSLHITITQPASTAEALPSTTSSSSSSTTGGSDDRPTEIGLRQGRWTAQAIRECVPDLAKRVAYVCGPDAFMTHIAGVLKDDLQSPAPVHTESFNY